MDVVDNNDFLFMYLVVGKQYLHFTWMLVDNNDFLECFSCIWLLETRFTFYMDVVNNNDFLDDFHVFGCLKQDLHFTWMLWIIMTSFSCMFYLDFTWMLWI